MSMMTLAGCSASCDSGGQGINIPLVYSYGCGGNRSSQATSVGQPLITQAVSNTFDNANRLLTSGSASYSYDANGNPISATDASGTTTYNWDARNRLTSISAPVGMISFTYDFGGNVIATSNTTSGLAQSFVLDYLTNIAYLSQNNADNLSILTGQLMDQHFGDSPLERSKRV